MGTGDRRGSRRALSEDEERQALRSGLFVRFQADTRYRHIIRQDLQPLWRMAAACEIWQRRPALIFGDVLEALSAESTGPDAPTLQRYVRAMVAMVGGKMGLMSAEVPATWALRRVHDDVVGRPGRSTLLSLSPRVTDDDLSLSLDMTPNSLDTRFFTGEPGAEIERRSYDFSHISIGYGTAHWTAVTQTACDAISNAVDQMRRRIDERYPARNAAAIDGWERDLDLLFAVLFRRLRPESKAEAIRLRRLCERMGIDSPLRRIESERLLIEIGVVPPRIDNDPASTAS